ncbi:MAG: hypothetical protein JST01_09455 [Cyanobacteria bacterium SZAS TMP-1]|nr:hypothetical protein [Cyanobacteria bacterium SZAS TMP-1]
MQSRLLISLSACLVLTTGLLPVQPAFADLAFKAGPGKNLQIAAVDTKTINAAQSTADAAPVVPPAAAIKLPTADPFPLSSKFSRRLQKYTGINWLSAAVASQAASFAVHRKFGGKVKVKIKTYSLTDLIAGKVKSVALEVRDPKLSGIGLGELTVKSANPIWYAYRKPKSGESRGLKTPVMLCVKANLSQKQIARALENPSVASKLHGLKLDLPGLGEQQLEVVKPKVEILDDLLKLEATLVTKGGTLESGVPVTIVARPRLVGDSQIVLEGMKVDSPDIVEPEKFADFTSKLLNPVVDFARMDRRDHAFRLDKLTVSGKDGDVEGDGRLLLVPRPSVSTTASQLAQKKGSLTQ